MKCSCRLALLYPNSKSLDLRLRFLLGALLCPSESGPVAIFQMRATRRRIVASIEEPEGDVPSLDLVQFAIRLRESLRRISGLGLLFNAQNLGLRIPAIQLLKEQASVISMSRCAKERHTPPAEMLIDLKERSTLARPRVSNTLAR